jgi:hypothetical protein
MVPFGLTQEQFLVRYRRCLEQGSAHLIAYLRELIARPVPSTVKKAEVQIFFGDDGTSIPSACIYYVGENTKVDHSDQTIFPGRSLELSIGLDSMDDFDEDYFINTTFGGVNIAANATKSWFAECWWKAGGWNYAVPAEVVVHDGFGDGEYIKLSDR